MPIEYDAAQYVVRLTNVQCVQVWCYDAVEEHPDSRVPSWFPGECFVSIAPYDVSCLERPWNLERCDRRGAAFSGGSVTLIGGSTCDDGGVPAAAEIHLRPGYTWTVRAYECGRPDNGTFVEATIDLWCMADFNHSGFVDGDDADIFTAVFAAGGLDADFDRNGWVNGDDADAFAVHFLEGC